MHASIHFHQLSCEIVLCICSTKSTSACEVSWRKVDHPKKSTGTDSDHGAGEKPAVDNDWSRSSLQGVEDQT